MRKKFYSATTITCFVLVILPCLITGCCESRSIKLKSYVIEYSTGRDIKLSKSNPDKSQILVTICQKRECLFEDNDRDLPNGKEKIVAAYDKDKESRREFDRLCVKNGDIKNNEMLHFVGPVPNVKRIYFSEQIKSVTVTGSVDIDAQHPTGSSLNDMFLFLSGSPDTFIDNGYRSLDIDKEAFLKDLPSDFVSFAWEKLFHVWEKSPKQTLLPVYGKLSDIDFSKYRLMGTCSRGHESNFALIDWVSPPPSNLDDYVLTVEIEFVDGVKKSASIAVKKQS